MRRDTTGEIRSLKAEDMILERWIQFARDRFRQDRAIGGGKR